MILLKEKELNRFLHHWIGFEQLFNLIDAFKVEDNKVNSSSDKLIIYFNEVLQNNFDTKLLYDLWGDIIRSKILGLKRVVSIEDGIYINGKIHYFVR